MILLLGYLASLFSTFVVSAAVLGLIVIVTTANKAPGHPYRPHSAQQRKHEPNKYRGRSREARAIAKNNSTPVLADAGRLPKIAGKEESDPGAMMSLAGADAGCGAHNSLGGANGEIHHEYRQEPLTHSAHTLRCRDDDPRALTDE